MAMDTRVTLEDAVEGLRSILHGTLIEPQDSGYDDARRVWNGAIDRRPRLIVQCATTDDVIVAVRYVRWSRDLWTALRPYAAQGIYVNFLQDEDPTQVREAYSAETWERLVALKDRYDRTNLFRLNQNVPPTGWSGEHSPAEE